MKNDIPFTEEQIAEKMKEMQREKAQAYYQKNKEAIKQRMYNRRKEAAINRLFYEQLQAVKAEQEAQASM